MLAVGACHNITLYQANSHQMSKKIKKILIIIISVELSNCHEAMHVPPPGALGSHQAIVVAWGVNAWHLGIFFKVSRIQNLMV